MKKFVLIICVILVLAVSCHAQPIEPPILPYPVYWTLAEIFNNIFSSNTLTIHCDVTGSSMTANITGTLSVTGSTVVIQDLNDYLLGVARSTGQVEMINLLAAILAASKTVSITSGTVDSTIVAVSTGIYTLPYESQSRSIEVAVSTLTENGTLVYTGKNVIGFSALVESVDSTVTTSLSGGFIAGTAVIKDGVSYSDDFPIGYMSPTIMVTLGANTTGYFVAKYYK